jgi:hypothetical protein
MNNEKISITSPLTLRWENVDRAFRFAAQLISAAEGHTVPEGTPPFVILPQTLQQAEEDSLFDHLPCSLYHAKMPQDSGLPDRLGIWCRPEYNFQSNGVKAFLDCDLGPQNLEIIAILSRTTVDKEFIPDMSLSLTFYGDWKNADGQRYLTRIRKIKSADIIIMPTADGRILELLTAISRMPELKKTLSPEDYDAFLNTLPAADPRYLFPDVRNLLLEVSPQ